jgi:hypothetical protein
MYKFLPYLLLVLATTADAALSESPKQLEARYGKTVDVAGDPNLGGLRTYYWNNLKIVVNVVAWKSREETYSHRNNSPLTGGEINELLSLNALGSVWQKQTQTGEARWVLATSKAVAVYPEKEKRHLLQVSECDKPCAQPSLSKAEVIRLADTEARRAQINLRKYLRPEVGYNQFSQDDTWFVWYVHEGVRGEPKFADAFSVVVDDKTRKVSVVVPEGLHDRLSGR